MRPILSPLLAPAMGLVLGCLALPAVAQDWCGRGALNATERAICADPILPGLDAQLNVAFAASGATRASQADWLDARNRCGPDIFCIERAYRDRIAALRRTPVVLPNAPRRPWCDAGRLNPTERAICADDRLADMDAALEAVYGSLRAQAGDTSQADWLRGDRDACGTDFACIGSAYLRRIVELGHRLRTQ